MSILGEVLKDLVGMFIADARLSAALLLLVALVAALLHRAIVGPGLGGVLLLVGSMALVLLSVLRAARR